MCSVCSIQSDVINFQHVLTPFVVFQSFTDLFRELNDREIENHYKMNSEKVESWHGIIISPTNYVQESREGYGKNWMHFVYKTDNLFRSIRISYGNLSVTTCISNYKKVESWHGIIIRVVEKVFTFSSLVSFPYCAVTMDNLHHLSGCLGQP